MSYVTKSLPVALIAMMLGVAIGYSINPNALAASGHMPAAHETRTDTGYAPLPIELWGRSWRMRSDAAD